MTNYYKITCEKENGFGEVTISTVSIKNLNLVPPAISFELLSKEELQELGNKPITGIYWTKSSALDVDYIIKKLHSLPFKGEYYLEYAFEI
ncbi:gp48 [Listeria phage P40]|uniref:gp48 n=1 Tax=Listeria phage P40 TaxID=560178 RepID=UPI00018198FD|nr:gp48 [Listeria phage P40]ACI00408.1 gp48 [Listeria phage P40]